MMLRRASGIVLAASVAGGGCSSMTEIPTAPTRAPLAISSVVVSSDDSAGHSCGEGLLAAAPGPAPIDRSTTRGLIRLRLVRIDIPGLRAQIEAGATLKFNLFDDACLLGETTEVAREEEGRLVWTGRLQDDDEQSIATVVTAEDVVTASIRGAGPRFFQILYAGDGLHAVLQIDPSGFPPD